MPQSNNSLQAPTPEDQRRELIAGYLEKYALIANRALTPELLALYEESLADVPVNRLRAGLKEYLREGDRWPWPSDIIEASELG